MLQVKMTQPVHVTMILPIRTANLNFWVTTFCAVEPWIQPSLTRCPTAFWKASSDVVLQWVWYMTRVKDNSNKVANLLSNISSMHGNV